MRIIIFAIFLTLVSCSDVKKEEELYNQISELELKLDYYKNGPEILYANINAFLKQELMLEAKELIQEL